MVVQEDCSDTARFCRKRHAESAMLAPSLQLIMDTDVACTCSVSLCATLPSQRLEAGRTVACAQELMLDRSGNVCCIAVWVLICFYGALLSMQ